MTARLELRNLPCIPGAGHSPVEASFSHGKTTTKWEPTLEQVGADQEPARGANGTARWSRLYCRGLFLGVPPGVFSP